LESLWNWTEWFSRQGKLGKSRNAHISIITQKHAFTQSFSWK
jgi:hypothetical protein